MKPSTRGRKQIVDTKVLFHAKYFDAEAERLGREDIFGELASQSIRIVQKTYDDDTVGIFGDVSELAYRQRISGKSYCYWRKQRSASLRWTKDGLLLLTTARHESGAEGGHKSEYVFSGRHARRFLNTLFSAYQNGACFNRRTGEVRDGIDVLIGPMTRDAFNDAEEELWRDLPELIGGAPSYDERFLVGSGAAHREHTHRYFVDSTDYREVTRRAFSAYNVTKPLVKAVTRLEGYGLRWFRPFRGLVPVEWIVESMNRNTPASLSRGRPLDERTLRSILRRLPQPVLRRILAEQTDHAMQTMFDACRAIRKGGVINSDITALEELVAARGQKNIRSSRDVEQIIFHQLPEIEDQVVANKRVSKRSLITQRVLSQEIEEGRDFREYNSLAAETPGEQPLTWEQWQDPVVQRRAQEAMERLRRERQSRREREREERMEQERQERMRRETETAQWAKSLTERLDGLTVGGGYTVKVAEKPMELTSWGNLMGNCIGGYGQRIGLDILGAIEDERGAMVLNFNVVKDRGLCQFLGKHNRDADEALSRHLAQQILDDLIAAGVDVKHTPLGADGLRFETPIAQPA